MPQTQVLWAKLSWKVLGHSLCLPVPGFEWAPATEAFLSSWPQPQAPPLSPCVLFSVSISGSRPLSLKDARRPV